MNTTTQTAVTDQIRTPDHPTELFIGGRWREGSERITFGVDNPATGQVLASVADAGPDDARAAIGAAHDAVAALSETSPAWRSELLRTIERRLLDGVEQFAQLITLEMGKPLPEARAEVAYAADFFGWFADEALRIGGDCRVAPKGSTRIVVNRRGVGPCLLITPWNFPLAMGARKVAPAIAAGCPSVLKPAEQTPLTSLLLARVIDNAGVPPGTLNVLTTSRPAVIVSEIIGSGRARKLSFTGSTEVGKLLLAQCAPHVMRTSMELGGNAPFIVFEDADIGAAVEGAMNAKMRNMGEACTAANRFFVADAIADDFIDAFAERMGDLVTGPGWLDGSDVGPLIDDDAVAKYRRLVDDALDQGGTLVTGGRATSGRFVQPTVISDIAPTSAALREEIFGPLAPIATFSSEDEVVARANDTPYGLISYVYTRDLDRSLRMLDVLETGMVGVNVGVVSNAAAPFGGIKESGLGREGGFEGIDEYVDTTYAAFGRS